MSETLSRAVAHIVTGEAVALGDPEMLIFPEIDGYPDADTRPIAQFGLGAEADLDDALTRLWLIDGWRPTGAASLVEPGYYVVPVEFIGGF